MPTPKEIVKGYRDIGEYPLYSTVCIGVAQATDLRAFAYKLGDPVPGILAGAAGSTELETNMEAAGQLGSGAMRVESIGISWWGYTPATFAAAAYVPTAADICRLDVHCAFSFEVNTKSYAKGKILMFPAGFGIYGSTDINNTEITSNGVPSFAARVLLRDPIEIGPTDTIVGLFQFPRGAITANLGGVVILTTWLFGVRSRSLG